MAAALAVSAPMAVGLDLVQAVSAPSRTIWTIRRMR
jgi:hypothetical protein